MDRRNFSKITLAAATGMAAIPGWANSSKKEKTIIRLGGPVFKKFSNPEEWIKALNELNYKAAYCPVNPGAGSGEISAYKNAAQKADIVIAEVGAWSNPIDPDEVKSKAALEKCIKSLQLADEIGAKCCVNISGSRNPEKWAGPHKDNLTPETFNLIVETTRKIIDEVKPKNSFFALETMPWAYPDSVDSYEKLIKAIDRKQFGVHFDPVNLVISPQVYYKNGAMISEAIKKLGPFIKSCHAKDILLLEDELTPHLPEVRAGLGNLNYAVFLKELSELKNIPLMLEHLNSEEEYKLAAQHIRKVAEKSNIYL
ncbi:MAG: sugar phosphate isomerase/epimerase [Draconibacterium sp.]|nr:sugar phosphate isomerase/epimerase [Draconibacterium sp.]